MNRSCAAVPPFLSQPASVLQGGDLTLLCSHYPLCFSFSSFAAHHFAWPEEGLASTDKVPALVLPLTSLSFLICKTRESEGAIPLSADVLKSSDQRPAEGLEDPDGKAQPPLSFPC